MAFSDWKIRRKAAFIFAVFLLLTSVIVGMREVSREIDDINAGFFGRIDSNTDIVNRNVGEKIGFVQGLVRAIASLEFGKDLFSSNSTLSAQAQINMRSYLDSLEHLDWIGLFQVAIINTTGHEIIRRDYRYLAGDYRAFAVDKSDLQDRSKEEYFSQILQLKKGEIGISDIHLNRENGEIKYVYGKSVPTIRFTTQLYYQNELVGTVVVSLYADLLFSEAFTVFSSLGANFSMISADGYFLYDELTPWTGPADNNFNITIWDRYPEFKLPEGNSTRLNQGSTVVLSYATGIQVTSGEKYYYVLELDLSPLIAQIQRNVLQIVALIVGLLIAIGVTLYLVVGRTIIDTITDLANSFEEASEGVLKRQETLPTREDEIGILQRAFVSLSQFLIIVLEEEKGLLEKIRNKSDNLSSIVEEISASSEEMSATAQSMAQGAMTQTELLSGILTGLASALDTVNIVSEEIRSTAKVISDVALQTSILALNAGIEASRAGDYGRGFAVVAENVRKLANETQKQVEVITKTSESIADRLENVFASIRHQVENVASVSEETSASAEEVVAAIEEISTSVQGILNDVEDLQKDAIESEKTLDLFRIE